MSLSNSALYWPLPMCGLFNMIKENKDNEILLYNEMKDSDLSKDK